MSARAAAGERGSAAGAYARFERLMARAITSPDPLGVIQRAARDRRLPEKLRSALAHVDADGLRMTALLVAKLRFERLLRGSPEAEEWFERDPKGFADAFRRYHAEVPLVAFFPPQEAARFRAWMGPTRGRRRTRRASPASR